MNLAEGVQLVSLGVLGLMMIAASIGVVLISNVVYSAFLLGGTFISVAGLYLLLNADFVATAQVLIYVGAINVLILFAIMLVNRQQPFAPVAGTLIRKIATAIICSGIFTLLTTMVMATPWQISTAEPIGDGAIGEIGVHFFTDFLLPFELASVLLLMALIGAVILARREFIPESPVGTDTAPALTLPERPRELVSASSDRSQQK